MKTTFPETMWAGTEHSFDIAVKGWADMQAHIQAQMQAGPLSFTPDNTEEEDLPLLLEIQGEVGVVSIKGSLVNSDSPWLRYFGMTGYPEVRAAMIAAAKHEGIKSIVLDIASGGGAVSGVADTASLISMVDRQVKPVYAITDGGMASAAYWLGASAREIYASGTAMVGSIGVIATVLEYSKALANEGVGVNVIRSGKYKALVNSVEPMSDVARTQLQAQLNAVYDIFIAHVADGRRTTVSTADSKMGQGREFIGQMAVEAGLVDAIETFDSLMSRINAKILDSGKLTQQNIGNYKGLPMKQALTEQELAAMAAGVLIPQEPATPAEPAAEAPVEGAPVEPAAEPAAAAKVTGSQAESDKVVDFLRAELKEAQASSTNLTIKLDAATKQIEAMQATHDALTKIVAQSTSNMRVALRLASVDLSTMSAESLLVEHREAAKAFTNQFKAGGVAAVTAPAQAEKKAPLRDAAASARLAASRIPNRS
jgi:signal peptide peptidase SppA